MKNKCDVAFGTTPMSFLVRWWHPPRANRVTVRKMPSFDLERMTQAQYTLRMKTNHQWLIAARPHGDVKESDFRWNQTTVADPDDGQVLIRSIYISLDPTNRIWMNDADSYLPALKLGDLMRGIAIGVVEDSKHPGFVKGDIVQGMLGWQQYAISDGSNIGKLPKGLPVPLTAFYGLLGHIGLTAYFGLLDITDPKAGETLVISTAAGAVVSLLGKSEKSRAATWWD